MDWNKIWVVLDVFLKAQNVPYTDVIRRKAMEELMAWNTEQPMEVVKGMPNPYAKPTESEPELEFGARRL